MHLDMVAVEVWEEADWISFSELKAQKCGLISLQEWSSHDRWTTPTKINIGLRQTAEHHYHNLNYHQNILQSTDSELTMGSQTMGASGPPLNDTGPLYKRTIVPHCPPKKEKSMTSSKRREGNNLVLTVPLRCAWNSESPFANIAFSILRCLRE